MKEAGMRARSLVFDLFGDYLRYRGGSVRLRGLVALLNCFDIPEATTRVSVARLRKEGWLNADRQGRETVYSLSAKAWQMLDEGRSRIFDRATTPWNGQWHMVLYQVPETNRAAREQLRKKLAWLGFGPLAAAVWVSPHDRIGDVVSAFADDPTIKLDVFQSRSAGVEADRDIAGRAWDLTELNNAYAEFLAGCRPRLPGYRSGKPQGASALVERMTLVHDYRHFPFRDPDLPHELLPADWQGRIAHEVFLEAHSLLRGPAESCVDNLLAESAAQPIAS
jgi:phenylacetic acid degradation operon negative regulatory protein